MNIVVAILLLAVFGAMFWIVLHGLATCGDADGSTARKRRQATDDFLDGPEQ